DADRLRPHGRHVRRLPRAGPADRPDRHRHRTLAVGHADGRLPGRRQLRRPLRPARCRPRLDRPVGRGQHPDHQRRAIRAAAGERRVGGRRAPVRQLHPPAGAGPQPGHRPAGGQLPRRRAEREHPGGREGQGPQDHRDAGRRARGRRAPHDRGRVEDEPGERGGREL
ncbi:MAG: Heat shock protein Hsp20, partial [uncultured Blastococcus sp.]